mgnify:CR=1 FL=1
MSGHSKWNNIKHKKPALDAVKTIATNIIILIIISIFLLKIIYLEFSSFIKYIIDTINPESNKIEK